MKIHPCTALVAMLALAGIVRADECLGLYKKVDEKTNTSTWDKLKLIAGDMLASGCSSASTVANQTLGRNRTARMRLEDAQAYDAAAAQADFDKAMQDPAVQEQLAAAKDQIADADSWQLYQATVFDNEGYYDARNLVVRQLQQKLGIDTK